MPPWHVSHDLKEWIPILFHAQPFKVKEICEILGIQKSLVYQTLAYHRDHGVPYTPTAGFAGGGWNWTLKRTDIKLIRSLLNQQHCLYLDEIQEELHWHHGVCVSVPTLLGTLHHLHFSQKVVSACALEHNELECSMFMNCMAELETDLAQLMGIDEALHNSKTSIRKMGWSLKCWRCFQWRIFVHGQRVSILLVKASWLVFAGPVRWTGKNTGIGLNPTAKDRTTSCGCTNSEFFRLPVAMFVEKSKNRKKTGLVRLQPVFRPVMCLTLLTHIFP